MQKATVFNIEEKKTDQREREMAMKPHDRLLLCLDLMDLTIALSPEKGLTSNEDTIQWIELRFACKT